MLADVYTPVGIYLRLRDRFRDTILLESADHHVAENSFSVIGINAIGGIEIKDLLSGEIKYPGQDPVKIKIDITTDLPSLMWEYFQKLNAETAVNKPIQFAQGLFGYTSWDAIPFFENITFKNSSKESDPSDIPLIRYRLYQYVIIIDHYKDELYICENHFTGIESRIADVESILKSKDVPVFPFKVKGEQASNITDEIYRQMVKKGIDACHRGDVFQVVLSRRFYQSYTGDDFNVYRALRSVNPSPYLFYFDYGDYKLMGSSPESQLIIENNTAIVHPIAGTFKRTGDDEKDKQLAIDLENDEKENAEHVMLVDLARNDLSKVCKNVEVSQFKKVNFYSHVIHLVSEVKGKTGDEKNPFKILGCTFPAGTLSGAPKYKAMQIIDNNENESRGFYGGTIGFIGLQGECNHAIMIRTFLSRNNTLISQAGAGIVAASDPENELQEVNNKLRALQSAVQTAQSITLITEK